VDFNRLEWVLRPEDPATDTIEKVAIQYGAFLNTLIQFLIVAWVVFLLVKMVNRIRRQQVEAAPEAPTPTEALLTEIRDALRK
jgi:large conductance mechanosensitive channel